jgi:hypothetical protein
MMGAWSSTPLFVPRYTHLSTLFPVEDVFIAIPSTKDIEILGRWRVLVLKSLLEAFASDVYKLSDRKSTSA